MSYTENETILPRTVEDEMKDSYLRYSMSVIVSRALPDVRDGLKPSQRRILYAMRQLNLSPGGKHRKCAKISGDTSGDYHPHGETVIYPTLVRLAQDWVMRYRLIDGQGNFGSIDGDPPAAMRYTEARLTHASMQLMEDLDKDTVEHVANYDETKKEPVVFPAKFPNLLCNGSSGIAVGMATTIPPHNLSELIDATKLLINDPQASTEDIMRVMPAPDFPTGGIICGYRGIREAFFTGRGKLLLRGKIEVEPQPKKEDREQLVISEIPYNIDKSRLVKQIGDLVNDKVIQGVSDLRDESDKDGLRVVVELKKGESSDLVLNQLYKYSDLQVTIGCNMLALDHGMPRIMNVKQMIQAWIDHRIDVIRRRTKFELKKAEARAHVLEGFLKAIDHLDEVVQLIKTSESREAAQKSLQAKFSFTERQAAAVLELRLYQLTGLERDKLTQEYQDLVKKIEYLQSVLASESMVRDLIKEELGEIQRVHKSERKTQIMPMEGEMNMEDLIAEQEVVITVSDDDYVKRMPIETFREQRRGGQGVSGFDLKRETDAIKSIFVASTHDNLLVFTNMGQCYWLKGWQIPEAGRKAKGKALINLIEDIRPQERIAALLCVSNFNPESYVIMSTRNGVIKKTSLSAFSNPRKNGIRAIEIDEGDELIATKEVKEKQQVMLFTREGSAVRFDQDQVRPMGRTARGVRGVNLKAEGDRVISCEVVEGNQTVLVVCENGFGKRTAVEDFRQTNRGGVGVRSIVTSERNGKVVGALKVTDKDGLIMMSSLGQTIRIGMEELRVLGRNTQGVRLANLKEGDVLVAVQKIEGDEEAATENNPE